MIDQIKAIGKDPAVLAQTIRQVRRQGEAAVTALRSEERRLQKELARSTLEAGKLAAAPNKHSQMVAVQERIAAAEQRLAEVRGQIESNNREIVDEDEIAAALSVFDPVWETLGPKERARIIQLLVERVDYDGKAGTIAVTFRPNGIKTLAQQQLEEAA